MASAVPLVTARVYPIAAWRLIDTLLLFGIAYFGGAIARCAKITCAARRAAKVVINGIFARPLVTAAAQLFAPDLAGFAAICYDAGFTAVIQLPALFSFAG